MSPFGSSAQSGGLQPELVSFSLSAMHPPVGTCLGTHCECPAVAYDRSTGSSWAVARCLHPGPRRQTWPQPTAVLGFAASTASRTRRVLQFHDRHLSSCI